MSPLRNPVRLRIRNTFLALLVLGIPGGNLAFAEDAGVAESTENTFRPDRILGVIIGDSARQSSDVEKVKWKTEEIKVVTQYFGSSAESTLMVAGSLKRDNPKKWHILWGDQDQRLAKDGSFHFEIPFNSRLTELNLVAVGPKGETEYHFYTIQLILPAIPKKEPLVEKAPGEDDFEFNQKLKKRFFISPGLGFSNLAFQQTDRDTYRSIVSTAKVSANYLIAPPKWDIGFSGFFNYLTLSKNSDAGVRFLGLNLRVGYIFPEVKAPWRLSLYGGWYYSTMFASDSTFGYKNVSGPQLFPVLRRNLGNGDALTTYFKYSPISSRLGILSLSNREMAVGLAYVIPTPERAYSVSVDFAQLRLSDSEVELKSTSISLGGSVTF